MEAIFLEIQSVIIFGVILIVAMLIPVFEGLVNSKGRYLFLVLGLAAAFAIRGLLMNYQSGDYNTFLSHWVEFFRLNDGFSGISQSVGNYNLPYLYFLALFSYLPLNDLYLIKLLSIAFDVVLAFGIMKIVSIYTFSENKRLAAYLITLLMPTVLLNGAYWGQCDSIYTAFAVLAIWCVMTEKPKSAMAFMALSFGFKLQAVFILPFFLIFLFTGKMKLRHLLVFPLTYIIEILPAVFLGRPITDAFMLYFNQANTVGSGLSYNSPSLFSIFKDITNVDAVSVIAIVWTFIYMLLILFWAWRKRYSISNESLLGLALLLVIGIPFLLPHMHDRYFFMADVLILVLAILYQRYAILTILVSFASLNCYYAYLNTAYFLPLSYGGFSLIVVMLILFRFTAESLATKCETIYSPQPMQELEEGELIFRKFLPIETVVRHLQK